MSECIVKMEMPETCYDCAFFCDDGPAEYCYVRKYNHAKSDCVISHEVARTGRMAWCPIICALPENHGRLVDAEEMYKKSEAFCNQCIALDVIPQLPDMGHEKNL